MLSTYSKFLTERFGCGNHDENTLKIDSNSWINNTGCEEIVRITSLSDPNNETESNIKIEEVVVEPNEVSVDNLHSEIDAEIGVKGEKIEDVLHEETPMSSTIDINIDGCDESADRKANKCDICFKIFARVGNFRRFNQHSS